MFIGTRERTVRRLARNFNDAEEFALFVENLQARAGGYINAAVAVDTHAIGEAFAVCQLRNLREGVLLQAASRLNIIGPDGVAEGVVDQQCFPVRAECQTIGTYDLVV